MKTVVFSAKAYDRQFLDEANASAGHELIYVEARLSAESAPVASGAEAVCVFVNDLVDSRAVALLSTAGIRLIALRCAGYNNVDLAAAGSAGIAVCRVPAYSPHSVAEHTFALILALNRKIHRAYNRVRECNFSLDGLLGFDLHGKTVRIVGVGLIGEVVAAIARGFGCIVLGYDPQPRSDVQQLGLEYVALEALLSKSDIVTLHCPLNAATNHLIGRSALERMRPGTMLINTSRGAVLDTRAVIHALKSRHLGALGIDVYEEEAGLFFEDRSDQAVADDLFVRLLTFPNVIVTGHQGFFTREALTGIAEATIANLDAFAATGQPIYPVPAD